MNGLCGLHGKVKGFISICVLHLMLRDASEHKWIEFSTMGLHVSSEIVFNFLKTVSAILFDSFFIAE